MIAEASPLLKIFEGSKQFEVPIYQRAYAWKEADWQQLWTDLLRAGRNVKANAHFVGSVVYIHSGGTFGSSVSRARLIDGQQRLTTIMLLMAALMERLQSQGDLVLEGIDEDGEVHQETITADWLQNTYLLNSTVTGELRFKLLLTQGDRATLMHYLGHVPLPDKPSQAVQGAVAFFRAALARADVKLADVFLGLRKLQVVNVQLEQGKDDPQLIFESLNSTGKDLTQADLIRNYVLMGLPSGQQKELYEHSWFPMEELFKGTGEDAFDRFVRDYLTLKTRVIPNVSKVYAEFKRYRQDEAKEQTTQMLVQELAGYARLYIQLIAPKRITAAGQAGLREALLDLDAVEVRVSYPFLLEVLYDHENKQLSADELIQIVRLVESFVVRRAVCELKTNPLNRIFSTLTKDLNKNDYVPSLGRALLRQRDQQRFPGDEEFLTELVRRPLYNSRDLCKAMLVRLERDLSPKELSVTDTLTIEHVLPQNENLSAPWREMLGQHWQDVQARLKHTIGNLTLTGYNSELGDLPFEKKKTLESPKGYQDAKMLMTRTIAQQAEWNETTILKRAQDLGTRALGLWAMPDLSAEEILSLRSDSAKPTINAWERLQALPASLLQTVQAVDQGMQTLSGGVRHPNRTNVVYRKGSRSFLYLSHPTDSTALACWLFFGETSPPLGSGWTIGKDKGWWRHSLTTVADVQTIWPTVETAWQRFVQSVHPPKPPNSPALRPLLDELAEDALAAFQALEQELLQLSPDLKRNTTQTYFGYGRPVEVIAAVRQGVLQVELRPPDPDLIPAGTYQGWENRSKERQVMDLHTPADVVRALPLIEAVHIQFLQKLPYRSSEIRELMKELRAIFQSCDPNIQIQPSQAAERYVVGERDIARIYINTNKIYLMLRHPYAQLDNPAGLGQAHDSNHIIEWGVGHFGGSIAKRSDLEPFRSLIQQTYQANQP